MLVDAAAHASGASRKLISPSYLCFGGKAGKIRNTGRVDKTNANGKKQTKIDNSTVVQAKYISQEKGILHLISLPLSNCLLSSVDHVAILFGCCFLVGLANSLRTAAC